MYRHVNTFTSDTDIRIPLAVVIIMELTPGHIKITLVFLKSPLTALASFQL